MTTSNFRSVVVVLQLFVAPLSFAKTNVDSSATLNQNRSITRTEVGGVVTGQTITLAGRAFYDRFATAWNEHDESGHFAVAISERPSARWGSQVFVDYGNRRLFQMYLPPNRSLIPAIGTEAAAQVYQAILEYQLAQFFGDPDMARDEQ
jgi:curli production assembly/transport component CsgE